MPKDSFRVSHPLKERQAVWTCSKSTGGSGDEWWFVDVEDVRSERILQEAF